MSDIKQGGCLCGKVRVSFSGEPDAHALCHCLDCRKIGGASYSNNVVVPDKNFKIESGEPKTISKIADSGKSITSHFCGDCGTTLFRTGESFPNQRLIKAGVLDDQDWVGKSVPKAELFSEERVAWIPVIDGAAQLQGMGT